jgi:type IV pilus assembly protein PilV
VTAATTTGGRQPARERRALQRGSALLEVLIAVLLFSIGIISLLRVLGVAVGDAGDVEFRAVAAAMADTTIGRMWVDRAQLGNYVVTNAAVAELPGGTQTVAVNGNVVTVTITWQPPRTATARTHTVTATLVGN